MTASRFVCLPEPPCCGVVFAPQRTAVRAIGRDRGHHNYELRVTKVERAYGFGTTA